MEWNRFQELIRELFSYVPEVNFIFESEQITIDANGKVHTYTVEEYNAVLTNLASYENNSTFISRNDEIEFLLAPISLRNFRRYYDKGIFISDESISYNLAMPTNEMILAFISSVSEMGISNFRRPSLFGRDIQNLEDEDGKIGLFNLISVGFHIYYSLKICSRDTMPKNMFQSYATSFLFNLSYNTSNVFKIITDISEMVLTRGHIRSRRLSSINELEPPKLIYKDELIEQYNLAFSTRDPFIEFLAYYHIMEYFFEDVRNEAVMNSVKERIQHPGFSANNPKEITKIVNTVRKISKEGQSGKEQEELELTIRTYVKPDQLCEGLRDYNPSLLEYYKNNEAHFSKGDKVDLEDFANMIPLLARRIYKTRNALVHNKSNEARVEEQERAIYHPLSDEKELAKEIPLMKILAEEIIICSATVIENM